jgi:hypothetical protein
MTGLAVQMPQLSKLLRWCYDQRYLLPTRDRHFVETLFLWRRSLVHWRWREPLSPEEHQRLCEIRDEIREKLANGHGAEAPAASNVVPFRADRTTLPAERNDDADELKRIERALNIWSDALSLRGTLAEQHLRSRGIEVPDEARQALAFQGHPSPSPSCGLLRQKFASRSRPIADVDDRAIADVERPIADLTRAGACAQPFCPSPLRADGEWARRRRRALFSVRGARLSEVYYSRIKRAS